MTRYHLRTRHAEKPRPIRGALRALRFLLRALALAALIYAGVVLFPYIRTLLVGAQGTLSSVTVSEKITEMGVLQTLSKEEDGLLEYKLSAGILGNAQQMTAPYHYQITFGIDMEQASFTLTDTHLTLTLPAPQVLSHKMNITGDVSVKDTFYRMTTAKYNEILDNQERSLHDKYAGDNELLAQAAEKGRAIVRELLSPLLSGSGVTLQID